MKKFLKFFGGALISVVCLYGFCLAVEEGIRREERHEIIHAFWVESTLEYGKYQVECENRGVKPDDINEWIHNQNKVNIPNVLKDKKWHFGIGPDDDLDLIEDE